MPELIRTLSGRMYVTVSDDQVRQATPQETAPSEDGQQAGDELWGRYAAASGLRLNPRAERAKTDDEMAAEVLWAEYAAFSGVQP